MKKFLLLLLIITGCKSGVEDVFHEISLDGKWQFKIDSLNTGIDERWYDDVFEDSVTLPGSMAENGKGNEVDINTPWVGDIIDRSYFTDDKYEKYRKPGNVKIPFWLKPVKYYRGTAWYQKEINIPDDWAGMRIELSFERCHWESTVYVNGIQAGSENSLAVPHRFDITPYVKPGLNKVSVRINNDVIIPIGVNSHSISDHTQSNWNGITGEMKVRAYSPDYIQAVKIYPDPERRVAQISVMLKNSQGGPLKGRLLFRINSINSEKRQRLPEKKVTIDTNSESHEVRLTYKIHNPLLWSEFDPSMYRLTVELEDQDQELLDKVEEDFGMRSFATSGTRFTINGQPLFLRGTTECCIFPLTGYPPSDYESWERILKICRDYGLNHIRFHSYCPPEAAFEAADRLGFYFHIECSSWANQGSSIGNGAAVDSFIYRESERILDEYGNHPSFCMLAYGNEPAGRNQNTFLAGLMNHWREIDSGRLYTSAAGWPVIPESDYHVIPAPRIQQWGDGLKSIINREPVNTMFDFTDIISKYEVPVISHEIGQWCVYPDLSEIDKYTGVLKASNFEIFRETLQENSMGDQAEEFLMASGKLQTLCYKADIEAALRTPGFAGFELLQLHDFPGQGTALVGILNPFFESKGYVSPEEFRMFCNRIVPLARMKKMVYTTGEDFYAEVEVSNSGPGPLKNSSLLCSIREADGELIYETRINVSDIPVGNGNKAGVISMELKGVDAPAKYVFEVTIEGTESKNSWDFWVYPQQPDLDQGEVYITDKFDKSTMMELEKGNSVLLLAYGSVGKNKGAEVAVGYSSIFWNTAWTRNQAPHTLGILCKPEHPVFRDFPTEFHTNYQWWDPVSHSQAMILDGFDADLRPLIQPIDTWFENRRLALALECRCSGGKLMVCSIDLNDLPPERIVSRQLLISILNYMNSDDFNPGPEIPASKVRELLSDK